MNSTTARALTGLAAIVAIVAVVALAIGLFRGSFTETVPVTVVSERAGLVMNPDAKVKMRGVEVGRVASIATRPDGSAVLKLDMNPSQLHLIPSNVDVDITSTTVFGAKYVELVPPKDPSAEKLHGGQVIQGQHVTTEINTVFQQLVTVLDKIDPAKLNETLGAVATAFNGRGEKIGRTLEDFNAFLAKINSSLPNLAHDIEASVPAFAAYGDAAPDLIGIFDNSIRLSNSIVEEQQNLDEFLISAIGLADIGNEVIGGNRQALTNVLQLLVPTTTLAGLYHETLGCTIGGLVPFVKGINQYSHIMFNAGLTLGTERYRWPEDLPKVAATTGGRSFCKELGLPNVPAEFKPPFLVADTGSNPFKYGNQGILLNSDGLKQWLFGPIGGPPRNSAMTGMPG
ncbi:MCE family protein [Mycolicibacterium tusciae]|uniref:MCE-family protein n=1 Tax=Mycolicibacterium tusciae TaxID=75922 RepID=A0A1X0JSD7_9MYCO|nr:MCE family protein [Mycolicibacterium tusciae]ORB65652.1 MCE-family protein [Mycolicibacterium tusciae]